MLIQFTAKNYRSNKDEQALSLVKGKGDELAATNCFSPDAPATVSLLRAAAIYGPNAAGKSNLMKALLAMKTLVMTSASRIQPGESLDVTPFLLDEQASAEASEFEATFVAEGVRYQYGFSALSERVTEEWLLAFPNGRPQRWFGRAWNMETQAYEWEMGSSLSGQKQLWQESTRANALFLSTAVQLNSQQLRPVYNWFSSTLKMTNVAGWQPGFTASLCQNAGSRDRVLDFLRAADLDIQDIRVEAEKISVKHLPDDMPDALKAKILEDMKDNDVYDVKTVHVTKSGYRVEFELDEESDGTRKIFAFAGPWIDVLKNGHVMFIDELHDNLHPKIVQFLVQLFHSTETNPKNAQLIFTTHDTSVLNQEVFRRDQIWFCEKDEAQATTLYPLTDFSPRKGRENLEAAYLAGRYGALPYLRALRKEGAA
ncbi:MAG: ATP-binding protein [Moraxellaceae bacterium]|nr:ATP-binding protein [Moraxellaceae bacterium]